MNEDPELSAMRAVVEALNPLDVDAQVRVLVYARQRFRVGESPIEVVSREVNPLQGDDPSSGAESVHGFQSFADLYDRTRPSTDAYKALVGGYWLQVSSGAADFESFFVNRELQNLGHKLANVTAAFTRLSKQKPVLAMQVRKSGKSAQARKRYKLTEAGIKIVDGLLKRERES